mmetsp:Transcript_38762/g.115274  ORF Transcript_38762/g.115274 Transcript_38762/m.115274 type:complete len:237 (-) Transcript_38762:150-860(-)
MCVGRPPASGTQMPPLAAARIAAARCRYVTLRELPTLSISCMYRVCCGPAPGTSAPTRRDSSRSSSSPSPSLSVSRNTSTSRMRRAASAACSRCSTSAPAQGSAAGGAAAPPPSLRCSEGDAGHRPMLLPPGRESEPANAPIKAPSPPELAGPTPLPVRAGASSRSGHGNSSTVKVCGSCTPRARHASCASYSAAPSARRSGAAPPPPSRSLAPPATSTTGTAPAESACAERSACA